MKIEHTSSPTVEYRVSGGYKIATYVTDDFTDALEEYLNRVRFTKPFSGAVIIMTSLTIENHEVTSEVVEHMVVMPTKDSIRMMCLDNSPEYYKLKYD